MKIKYDKEADALYIEFSPERVYKTVEKTGNVLIDFDKKGNAVGVEVLHYFKVNPAKKGLEVFAGTKRISIPV